MNPISAARVRAWMPISFDLELGGRWTSVRRNTEIEQTADVDRVQFERQLWDGFDQPP